MPTPRRSRSSTPATSTRASSVSRTPVPQHHRTADELAAEEAASLLTPVAKLRGSSDVLDGGSARALRHKRLNEVREVSEHKREMEEVRSNASRESREDPEGSDVASVVSEVEDQIGQVEASTQGDDDDVGSSSAGPSARAALLKLDSAADDESDSADDSSSATASDSESDSDSETSETDTEDDDDDDERMERLLRAAKIAAEAKATAADLKGKGKASDVAQDDDEVVLQFDEDQKEKRAEAPIPDLAVPKLPKAHLSFTDDGRAAAATQIPSVPSSAQAGPSKRPTVVKKKSEKDLAAPELDDRPYEKQLSKREKASQPRKATTSELWASIPTPRSDLLPQMKRDYQALALANSLDPKRFMKGGSRSDKIPEAFAIGTMVDAPRHLQATTLTKERKYRAGEVVQSLIKDDSTGDYAKRKYGDLQWNRMENGRGKGWRKRTKW
ncbi:hypothetical protein IAU60_003615 [Kwoniella sp. DSM 27419]